MSLTSFLVLFVVVFTALYVLGVKSLPKASTVWNKLYRILMCILFTNIFVAIIPMGLGWYDGVTLSENKEVQIYRTFKVEFVSDKMVVTSGDDVIYDGKRELLSKPNIHFFENPTFTTNLSLNEDSYSSGETEYTKKLKNSQLVVTRVVEEKFVLEPGKGLKMKKEIHIESFFVEEVVPRVSFSNK